MPASGDLKLNTTSTARIAYDGLRQLTMQTTSARLEGPSRPWELLKSSLSKEPRVFVLVPSVSVGDVTPFMRLIHDLIQTLPGQYIIHRADLTGYPFYDQYSRTRVQKGGSVTEVGEEDWLRMLQESPPDAVLSTQIFFLNPQGDSPRIKIIRRKADNFRKKMRAACAQSGVTIIPVEFPHVGARTIDVSDEWRDRLAAKEVTTEQYRRWNASPPSTPLSQFRVHEHRQLFRSERLPGAILLACYPAEFMTEGEVADASGVVCGHVSPKLGRSQESQNLEDFIAGAHAAGREVVLLARGGLVARGTAPLLTSASSLFTNGAAGLDHVEVTDIKALADYELTRALAGQDISVVAMGVASCQAKKIESRIFCLPYLGADFAHVFPKVDLIVHHGGAGTTMAALESGTPQLIIPNAGDTSDQIHHGARVSSIGCGSFLRPLPRLDEAAVRADRRVVNEVVAAVQELLQGRHALKGTCAQWKTILGQDREVEGVPIAVDTLRRLVAAAVVEKATWSAERS